LSKKCTETYDIITMAFGEDSMGRSRVFEWFRRVKEVQTFVERDKTSRTTVERAGRVK